MTADRRSLTVAQVADQSLAADGLVPLVPARILDTATGLGITGAFWARRSAKVLVAGRGGVPASGVGAVMVSVTGRSPSANGYVTVFRGGARPASSSLTLERGMTVTTSVLVPLAADGTVAIYNAAGTVQLQADVTGWLGVNGPFHASAPTRALDTRRTAGPIPAGSTRLVGTRVGGVPSDSRAVAVTVVAVSPQADGYLTVFPSDEARSATSTMSYRRGHTTTNFTVSRVSVSGDLTVFASGTTHVVVDVVGSFSPDGTYHAISPQRAFDSRKDTKGSDGKPYRMGSGDALTWDIWVNGRGGVPLTGVAAVMVNVTAAQPSADTSLTLWPTRAGTLGASRPRATTLSVQGAVSRTSSALIRVGTDGMIRIWNAAGYTHLVVDVVGYVTTTGTNRATLGAPTYPGVTWEGAVSTTAQVVDVSDDGRYVLVLGGNALLPYTSAKTPVIVRDVVLGLSTLVVPTDGATPLGISGDGRRVLFRTPTSLVAADSNRTIDVYWCDLDAATYWLVSASHTGGEWVAANDMTVDARTSYDGRWVALVTEADNLAPSPPASPNGVRRLAVVDMRAVTSGEEDAVAWVAPCDGQCNQGLDVADDGTIAWFSSTWVPTRTSRLLVQRPGAAPTEITDRPAGPPGLSRDGAFLTYAVADDPEDPASVGMRVRTLATGDERAALPPRNGATGVRRYEAVAISPDGSRVSAAVQDLSGSLLPSPGSGPAHLMPFTQLQGEATQRRLTSSSPIRVGLHPPVRLSQNGAFAAVTSTDPVFFPDGAHVAYMLLRLY